MRALRRDDARAHARSMIHDVAMRMRKTAAAQSYSAQQPRHAPRSAFSADATVDMLRKDARRRKRRAASLRCAAASATVSGTSMRVMKSAKAAAVHVAARARSRR